MRDNPLIKITQNDLVILGILYNRRLEPTRPGYVELNRPIARHLDAVEKSDNDRDIPYCKRLSRSLDSYIAFLSLYRYFVHTL